MGNGSLSHGNQKSGAMLFFRTAIYAILIIAAIYFLIPLLIMIFTIHGGLHTS